MEISCPACVSRVKDVFDGLDVGEVQVQADAAAVDIELELAAVHRGFSHAGRRTLIGHGQFVEVDGDVDVAHHLFEEVGRDDRIKDAVCQAHGAIGVTAVDIADADFEFVLGQLNFKAGQQVHIAAEAVSRPEAETKSKVIAPFG